MEYYERYRPDFKDIEKAKKQAIAWIVTLWSCAVMAFLYFLLVKSDLSLLIVCAVLLGSGLVASVVGTFLHPIFYTVAFIYFAIIKKTDSEG